MDHLTTGATQDELLALVGHAVRAQQELAGGRFQFLIFGVLGDQRLRPGLIHREDVTNHYCSRRWNSRRGRERTRKYELAACLHRHRITLNEHGAKAAFPELWSCVASRNHIPSYEDMMMMNILETTASRLPSFSGLDWKEAVHPI
jgi:hypothetical protein